MELDGQHVFSVELFTRLSKGEARGPFPIFDFLFATADKQIDHSRHQQQKMLMQNRTISKIRNQPLLYLRSSEYISIICHFYNDPSMPYAQLNRSRLPR